MSYSQLLYLILFSHLGSQAAFHRVYEDPILQSRLPTATVEDKDVGENRAKEVHALLYMLCSITSSLIVLAISHAAQL